MGPELLFLHYVFWFGQHVYMETCLHANDTQMGHSLLQVQFLSFTSVFGAVHL